MIDYDKMIDLYNVTVNECLQLYENSSMCTLIEDGMIINFFMEGEGGY